ncbi:orotate phosphoribosyltransferase [uncultured Deinococcus sp.]|uniref:orotate phosphoribosyltransferase n=1 Tax=uncultured Deinococcus sp. TaxID=158789 RepID=UPI0025828631|nr:orotate phosphoribosyltransferase [uncultured Deinococcus sp.]
MTESPEQSAPNPMPEQPTAELDVLTLYRDAGAFHEGRFLLASGRQSPFFLQSTTLLQHPRAMTQLGGAMARQILDAGLRPDFVVGPAMGGVTLAYEVARQLSDTLPEVRGLFAEKDGQGGMKLREAFEIRRGETFVAVEDVLTTGGSLLRAVRAVEAYGAQCVGLCCIIDRRAETGPLAGYPLMSLKELHFETYAAHEVPGWLAERPLREI